MTTEELIQSKIITFKGTTFSSTEDVQNWMEKAMKHVAENAEEEYRDFLTAMLQGEWKKESSS